MLRKVGAPLFSFSLGSVSPCRPRLIPTKTDRGISDPAWKKFVGRASRSFWARAC